MAQLLVLVCLLVLVSAVVTVDVSEQLSPAEPSEAEVMKPNRTEVPDDMSEGLKLPKPLNGKALNLNQTKTPVAKTQEAKVNSSDP